ncbi:MAG TPA: hypothetical protein VL201_03205 [Patescibacteria group bacterium]|jgi:hypothetical protein|nr:hypothetical protein [Patescibacteria group bacterium]
MKYKKLVYVAAVAILFIGKTMYTSDTITLTKSEIAKLKDYLIKTRDDAKTKVKEVDARIDQMRAEKMDLQSDAVKAVKDDKYHWQDIVDGNNKLLEQLRTGKYTYSLVVAQLKSLGTNPQEALQATGIRARLFAGEKVHPLLVEIDSINPNKSPEELNEAFAMYKIGKASDGRMNYVLTDLLNRLLNKHREILDKNGLKDAIASIEEWTTIFQDDSKLAKVLKTRIIGDPVKRTRAYATIDQIKKEHDL